MGGGALAARCVSGGLRVQRRRAPWFWEITRSPHARISRDWSALRHALHNGWDHALKVIGDGQGLVGHAAAILLRKAADQAGLTVGLGAALRKARTSPLFDRGTALMSMAVAIALGATSMSDIAVLAHLAPVPGQRRADRRYGAPWTWLAARPCWPSTVHRGAHSDLDISYGQLGAYGHRPRASRRRAGREAYLVGPRETADQDSWRTEIAGPSTREPSLRTQIVRKSRRSLP